MGDDKVDDDGLLPHIEPYSFAVTAAIIISLALLIYSVKLMLPRAKPAEKIPVLQVNVPGTKQMCPLVRLSFDGNKWSCK